MLAYVTMHLLNHSAGLVSLTAMERTLDWVAGLWALWPMQVLLYGSFVVHYALALSALWQRRSLRLRPSEWAQLALGFAIPLLLVRHVVNIRVAHDWLGTGPDDYTYVLFVFFVRAPWLGVIQVAPGGTATAARRGAGRIAGPDHVPEPAAGPVAMLGLRVLARSADDRIGLLDVQEPQEAGEGHGSWWPPAGSGRC